MRPSIRWIPRSLACAFLLCSAAHAATPELLATKAGCAACHLANKKLLGPSYHEIAVKYRGDAKAPAALAAKVRTGGTGVWGKAKMLPLDARKVSDADLATVIGWILRQ